MCVCIAGCIAVGVLICYCVKKKNKNNAGQVISQQPTMVPIDLNVIHFNANTNNMSMPLSSYDLNNNHNRLPPLVNKNPKLNDFSNTAKTLPDYV